MKIYYVFFQLIILTSHRSAALNFGNAAIYSDAIKIELQKKWRYNSIGTFHGYYVPSGFFCLPHIPSLFGEQSEEGPERYKVGVPTLRHIALFIDYVLKGLGLGLVRAKLAWERMTVQAMPFRTQIAFMTFSPYINEIILSPGLELTVGSRLIRQLPEKYTVGLGDSYRLFREIANGEPKLESKK